MSEIHKNNQNDQAKKVTLSKFQQKASLIRLITGLFEKNEKVGKRLLCSVSFKTPLRAYFHGLSNVQPHFWNVGNHLTTFGDEERLPTAHLIEIASAISGARSPVIGESSLESGD